MNMQQFDAKKWVFVLMILLSLVIDTKTAFAVTAKPEITKIEINVMPEYDTLDILIIYSVDFKNTSDQPYLGEFVWNLPHGSKKYTVVDKSKGDNHLEPTVKHSEKNDQIVWNFPTPLQPGETKPVQIEYYYNNLQGNPDKTFVYEYVPEYPVVQAEIIVFQPKQASNLIITPDYGQPQPGYDGFTIYKKEFNNLKPGANVQIKASYTKSDPHPSVAPQSEQQGKSGQPTQSAQSERTIAVILLFFAALVAIGCLIIYKGMKTKHNPIKRNSEDDYEDGDFIMDKEIREMQNPNKTKPSRLI